MARTAKEKRGAEAGNGAGGGATTANNTAATAAAGNATPAVTTMTTKTTTTTTANHAGATAGAVRATAAVATGKAPAGVTPTTTATANEPTLSYTTQQMAAASRAFLDNLYGRRFREASAGVMRVVGPRERNTTIEDFDLIKRIGRGSFGEVFVCQRKGDASGRLYALKKLQKAEMLRRRQVTNVRAEKALLAQAASHNPWVVYLYKSFQDKTYLYLLLEYMPAGDMMTWLCDKERFSVEATRFYIAEVCMAVASVHAMNYAHRDIKPDNVLFGLDGHIKLSDFGLCKRFDDDDDDDEGDDAGNHNSSSNTDVTAAAGARRGGGGDGDGGSNNNNSSSNDDNVTDKRVAPPLPQSQQQQRERRRVQRPLFNTLVGSVGYMAPEVLLRQGYNISCDWWSVGVIMYEMLYGYTPFYSPDNNATYRMIARWRDYLRFPPVPDVPEVAVQFMRGLLCDAAQRMTFADIRAHPFFDGVDLDHIRETKAVYQPVLSNPLDTRYFEQINDAAPGHRAREECNICEIDPYGALFADFQST